MRFAVGRMITKTSPTDGGDEMALEREIATYEHHLLDLLKDAGKYVVIRGEEILGVFEAFEDAVRKGYETGLNDPFLTRRIAQSQPILSAPRSIRPCPS